jgi:hypothetical protein
LYFKSNINIKAHKGSTYGIRVIGFVPTAYYSLSVNMESYGVCQIQTILIQLKWSRPLHLSHGLAQIFEPEYGTDGQNIVIYY